MKLFEYGNWTQIWSWHKPNRFYVGHHTRFEISKKLQLNEVVYIFLLHNGVSTKSI